MWYAGIDWADRHHDAVIIDAAGQRVAAIRVEHSAAGLAKLTDFLRRIGDVAEHPEQLACIGAQPQPGAAAHRPGAAYPRGGGVRSKPRRILPPALGSCRGRTGLSVWRLPRRVPGGASCLMENGATVQGSSTGQGAT